jgi:hypothetical protein
MFYLKFLPILEQKLSKTYFNLLLLNHFTSKGKNKTSLRDDRNKCQKSHQIGIEQVNSKENENNLYLLTQNKKDAHILKIYKKKKKKVPSGSNAKIQAYVAPREKVPKNDQKVGKAI